MVGMLHQRTHWAWLFHHRPSSPAWSKLCSTSSPLEGAARERRAQRLLVTFHKRQQAVAVVEMVRESSPAPDAPGQLESSAAAGCGVLWLECHRVPTFHPLETTSRRGLGRGPVISASPPSWVCFFADHALVHALRDAEVVCAPGGAPSGILLLRWSYFQSMCAVLRAEGRLLQLFRDLLAHRVEPACRRRCYDVALGSTW